MNINNAHAGSVFERLNLENGREQFVSSFYRPYDLSLGRPAAASIVSRNRVPLDLQFWVSVEKVGFHSKCDRILIDY